MDKINIIEKQKLYNFYREMYLIRRTEETLLYLFSCGLLNGTVHTCIGQEACSVGVVSAIDKDRDIIFSNHRAHGHFITYCDKVKELIAEIMGKKCGICGGIGGSQHIHHKNMYTNGIQGGIVPCATGAALAEKKKKTGAIVIVFMGDGTMGQGIVYECFNLASLWNLPILFVLEDNQYAQSTPKHMAHAGNLDERANPYGIKSDSIIASSVESVYLKAVEAINYVRMTQKPFFLHLNTYRFSAHSKGDDCRDKDEIECFLQKDPLLELKNKLDNQTVNEIENSVNQRIESIILSLKNEAEQNIDDCILVKSLKQ